MLTYLLILQYFIGSIAIARQFSIAVKVALALLALTTITAVIAAVYAPQPSVLAGVIAVSTVTAWFVVHTILTRPLRNLIRSMRSARLGTGSGISRPGTGSGSAMSGGLDEIDELTFEYEKLSIALRRWMSKVDQLECQMDGKLAERTSELRRTVRTLQRASHMDKLTGIANRRSFDEQLSLLYDQSVDDGVALACIMIDVDNFKAVNDTFGHAVGDQLLSFVGELLRSHVREFDFVCRYGGDEFIVLLPDCSAKEAVVIAERIRKTFAKESLEFGHCDGDTNVQAYLSVGVANTSDGYTGKQHELIASADRALYRAKRGGRNRVAVC